MTFCNKSLREHLYWPEERPKRRAECYEKRLSRFSAKLSSSLKMTWCACAHMAVVAWSPFQHACQIWHKLGWMRCRGDILKNSKSHFCGGFEVKWLLSFLPLIPLYLICIRFCMVLYQDLSGSIYHCVDTV